MKSLRRIISLLLVTVYVTSFVGYDVTMLTCRCLRHSSCTCMSCMCNAGNSFDGIHATRHCCGHDHSAQISLYDSATNSDFQKIQVATLTIPSSIHSDFSDPCEHDWNIPLNETIPEIPELFCRGLRAPPVLA